MNKLTPQEIKARIHLEQVIKQDWQPPVKRYADWWMFFCPFHPNTRTPALGVNLKTGTFKCFSGECGVQGDLFTWHMLRHNTDFKTAQAYYREQLPNVASHPMNARSELKQRRPAEPPGALWQLQALAFLQLCQTTLWEAGGEPGRKELARRGVQEYTARRWSLGYNPRWRKEPGSAWGLPHAQTVWLPRGLTIPAFVGMDLWYLKIRIFGHNGKPVEKHAGKSKYLQIQGSRPALFGMDHFAGRANLLLAESELDAILVWQESGDLLDIASLGGAGKQLDSHWIPYLLPYRRIFLAYDQDKAGLHGARKLAALSQRLVVSPPPEGDLTDFHQTGGDVRDFIAQFMST